MPRTLLNVYHFIKKLIQSTHTNNQFSLRVPSLHINHFSLRVPSLHINQISLRVPSLHIDLTSLRVRPTIRNNNLSGSRPAIKSIPIKVHLYKSISLIIIPFKMTNNSIHMIMILTHLAVYSFNCNTIFISNKTF